VVEGVFQRLFNLSSVFLTDLTVHFTLVMAVFVILSGEGDVHYKGAATDGEEAQIEVFSFKFGLSGRLFSREDKF
jgi:hypothetical protein